MKFIELPESERDELTKLFLFRTSSDKILSTLMRVSRELPGYNSPQEIFEMTKNYLVENKFKLNENIKQFEKTARWDKLEDDEK